MNHLLVNCAGVVLGQTLSMYSLTGSPRNPLTSIIVPLILGGLALLLKPCFKLKTVPLAVGLLSSSLFCLATLIAMQVHPWLGWPLYQVPVIITAMLTVRQETKST